MKLKEYLRYLVDDEPVTIIDADSDKYWCDRVHFLDKTIVPKEVSDLDVSTFRGSLYHLWMFQENDLDSEVFDSPFPNVLFFVKGFREVADRLGLHEIVKE